MSIAKKSSHLLAGAALVCVVLTGAATAQINVSITETFDGNGPNSDNDGNVPTGFDVPGWNFPLVGPQFAGSGAFDGVDSFDTQQQVGVYVVTVDAPTVGDIYQALNGINRQFDDPVTKTNMLKPGAPLTVHNRLENPDIGTLATAQSLDLGTLIFSGLGSSNPSAAPGIAALPEVVTASLDLATGNAASSAQIDSAATQIFVGPGATAAELNPNGGPIVSVDSWYSIQQDPNGGSLISVDVAVNDNAAVNVLNLVGTGPGSYGLDLTNRSTLVMSAGATGVEFIFPIADPTPGANEPIASGNTGPGIDFAHFEANYTVVPEPSSLFLLALAGLGLTRGRRGR